MGEKTKKSVNKGSLTPERARELQRKGAEVRRANSAARRSAREFAEAALNAEVTDKSSGKKVVVKDAVIQKLVAKAIQESNLKAIKYLFELIGESPAQKLEVTGKDGESLIPRKPMTREEIRRLHKELEEE